MELFNFYILVDGPYFIGIIKNYVEFPEKFLIGLFRYFSDVEFSGEENIYYSKYKFRRGIIKVLDKLWDDKKYSELTIQARDTEEFHQFVGFILTDLIFCMDEGFDTIPKYKELIARDPSQLNQEELTSLDRFKSTLEHSFTTGKELLKSLRRITDINPQVFAKEDWKKKFANVVNYYAQKLSRKNFKKFKVNR